MPSMMCYARFSRAVPGAVASDKWRTSRQKAWDSFVPASWTNGVGADREIRYVIRGFERAGLRHLRSGRTEGCVADVDLGWLPKRVEREDACDLTVCIMQFQGVSGNPISPKLASIAAT